MNSAYQVSDQVYRTRQIALLLSDADRATALAYAAELESRTATPPWADAKSTTAPRGSRR